MVKIYGHVDERRVGERRKERNGHRRIRNVAEEREGEEENKNRKRDKQTSNKKHTHTFSHAET